MSCFTADELSREIDSILVREAGRNDAQLTIKPGRLNSENHARLIVASSDDAPAAISYCGSCCMVEFSAARPGRNICVAGNVTDGINITGDNNVVNGNRVSSAIPKIRLTVPSRAGALEIYIDPTITSVDLSALIGNVNFTLFVRGKLVLENGTLISA